MKQFDSIGKPHSTELDSLLGIPFPVLDDGFIRVIDYMGTDESIVQAARVSYGKGTKQKLEDDALIRYLIRQTHTSPLEMCELKLHIRIPMDAWRQFIRHRTMNVNEYSTRYSEAIEEKYCASVWRAQSTDNKQGSSGVVESIPDGFNIGTMSAQEFLSKEEKMLHRTCKTIYENRLKFGVAREQARKDLPLSTYTEAYIKFDLHNLLHFLRLRMDSHAQEEIRAYATIIGEKIVSKWVPSVWQAFLDYTFNAMRLSTQEQKILSCLFNDKDTAIIELQNMGWFEKNKKGVLKSHRERQEFEAKLNQLNITIPWTI
jgi:thymidylate synthase (FAD)